MVYRLFERANDRVRETTVIVLGQIGRYGSAEKVSITSFNSFGFHRIATAEVLGQTVCCLISQLGHQNPILKGTTHVQVTPF